MPRLRIAAITVLAGCGSSGSATHDAPRGIDAAGADAPARDAAVDVAGDAPGGVTMYSPTPTQTLVPPANVGNGYGLVAAIADDGKTLVTFDTGALYVFTRAATTDAFATTPAQTIPRPTSTSVLGTGLSITADGALVAIGASATGGSLEVLVYTRQGSAYGTTPDVVPATSGYSEIAIAELAPDSSQLAVDTNAAALAILPRSGSMYSTTPSRTIPKPTGASGFFPMAAGLSATGSTLAIGDSGVSGGGGVYVYTSATTPVQTLTPIVGESDFGTSVAMRSDAAELVVGSIGGAGQVGVFQHGSSGFTRLQTITPPSGATSDFSVSVSLAHDGTLVVTDYGAHIYIFSPT